MTWAGFLIVFGVGAVMRWVGVLPVDRFPPLHAEPRRPIRPLLPATVLVAALPVAARRLRHLVAVAWAVVLALPDGLAGLPATGDAPIGRLRHFTGSLPYYPTHVRRHLLMLTLWTMRWTGLDGPGWAAALVIAAGRSATVAIAVMFRALSGPDTARRAVPLLALAPTAIWVPTSMDALFLGVASWGVALCALGGERRPFSPGGRSPRPPWGANPTSIVNRCGLRGQEDPQVVDNFARGRSGGASPGRLGVCDLDRGRVLPYLSHGLLTVFALPLAGLVLVRPERPVPAALAAGTLVVPAAFTLAGSPGGTG